MPEEKTSPPPETKKMEPKKEESKRLDSRMDNKPGELPFQLELDPKAVLLFKSDRLLDEPVAMELKITNPTSTRQAFKIKCTSNSVFRVRMPFGFVEPNSTHVVKITFQSKQVPKPGAHFFALHHIATDAKQQQAKWLWTTNPKPDGVARLPCDFQKADGTQWVETEKK